MRLTLRTLLAYMDDILEPADHEDLGKKIESSDFATELIHRSRDAVRRLRLGAPQVNADDTDDVLGSASVADANAVAEYLDNTLPPEDVADFERLCLEPSGEADMHLAEVVSCHHVLTMVLGEPAEVNGDLKERIYRLRAAEAGAKKLRIEPAHVADAGAPPAQAPAVAPIPATGSPAVSAAALPIAADAARSELPDYLRAAAKTRGRTKRLVAAVATVVLAGLVGWLAIAAFSEPELHSELSQSDVEKFSGPVRIEEFEGSTSVQPADTSQLAGTEAPPFEPGDTVPHSEPPTQESVEAVGPSAAEQNTDQPPLAFPPDTGPSKPGEEESKVPAGATGDVTVARTDGSSDSIDNSIDNSTDRETNGSPGERLNIGSAAPDEPTTSVAGDTRVVERPVVAAEREGPAAIDATEDVAVGSPSVTADAHENEPEPDLEPRGPVQLGNYLGNNDVLLWFDEQTQAWVRLPPRSALSTGDALLTLPKFRTHVVLADMNIYLSGGTRVGLPNGDNRPGARGDEINLKVDYGRLLLNAGLKGNRIAIQVGEEARECQLESSASLAVEVRRVFVPGSDFEGQSPVEAVWYLTSGTVVWPSAAGEEQTIQAPAMWKTAEGIDDLPENILELPAWIDRETMTDSERRARATLANELAIGEPVTLRLQEITDGKGLGRRKEVRTLASEASVYVGIFEPSVKALNDTAQHRRTWTVQIEALRQAMARSPEIAGRVSKAIVNLRGERAMADLMELLSGYSPEEIGDSREARQDGALAKLLGWLEHDSLDYRVLAIHNLNEITGTSYLEGYRASGPSQGRKIAVKKLWDRLESGDMVPAN